MPGHRQLPENSQLSRSRLPLTVPGNLRRAVSSSHTATKSSQRGARVTAATEGHGPDALPFDFECISDCVDRVLAITLCMPERQDIDHMAGRLRGALNMFLVEDLGFDSNHETRRMYAAAHRLLELHGRPTPETPPFTAYEYVRELARLTRRFVDLYRDHSADTTGSPSPALPSRIRSVAPM
nr:DUF6415 family natural product biosynthesis protein [Streptomyces sp. SID8358]